MKLKLKKTWGYVSERISIAGLDLLMIVLMSEYTNQLSGSHSGHGIRFLLISLIVSLNMVAVVIRDAENFNDKINVLNYLLVVIVMYKYAL
ncbi:hypothetical protein [Liquorilactobacillus hordei]|uniref:hypothetical protein n=1 Tax=Liquorilactobacillus hordei TaxID=468911 RepID=UPI0039E90714